jgi:hypothetical protein
MISNEETILQTRKRLRSDDNISPLLPPVLKRSRVQAKLHTQIDQPLTISNEEMQNNFHDTTEYDI